MIPHSPSSSLSFSSSSVSSSSPLCFSYESFVIQNQSWFLPAFETARSLTIFLPGRFNASEIRSEAIYTALNLLTAYHDWILARPRRTTASLYIHNPTASLRRLQHVLTALHYSCVLIEMAANKLTTTGLSVFSFSASPLPPSYKWLIIFFAEAIRAYCRIRILLQNQGQMLVAPTQEQFQMESLTAISSRAKSSLSLPPGYEGYSELVNQYLDHGRVSDVHAHGIYDFDELTSSSSSLGPSSSPSSPSSRRLAVPLLQFLSEVIEVARPSIYVLFRGLCGDSSFVPLLSSLMLDVIAKMNTKPASFMSEAEKIEWNRRILNLILYAFRTPVFERFTKGRISWFADLLSRIPLIGFIFRTIFDIAVSLQSFYFYTSAS